MGVVRETVSALKSSLSLLFLVIVPIRYDNKFAATAARWVIPTDKLAAIRFNNDVIHVPASLAACYFWCAESSF